MLIHTSLTVQTQIFANVAPVQVLREIRSSRRSIFSSPHPSFPTRALRVTWLRTASERWCTGHRTCGSRSLYLLRTMPQKQNPSILVSTAGVL